MLADLMVFKFLCPVEIGILVTELSPILHLSYPKGHSRVHEHLRYSIIMMFVHPQRNWLVLEVRGSFPEHLS